MSHTHPAGVMQRLADIETDLGTRQGDYETAADDRARLVRDWEHRLAVCMATAKGPNADSRKANALLTAIEKDNLYERLRDAEARFEACKVVVRTLETRATIGMSILRSQGRA